ncbi:MAG: lamin tail domain-containing protein [Lishizhenia sp.]
MHYLILFILLFFSKTNLFAQIFDDFSDGDFTTSPIWIGTDPLFQINSNNELQLNDTQSGNAYLTTASGLSTFDNKEWHFRIKQSFSPSGSNNGKVYLSTSNTDLSTNPDGLFLLFGESGSADAIRLIERTAGVNTEILAGSAGAISNSFDIRVKIIYDNLGNWTLSVDPNAGENYLIEASTNYPLSVVLPYFGINCNYTSSNSTKFYFDDFYVGDIIVDLDPPIAQNITVISANELDIIFNEALSQNSAQNVLNYSLDNTANPVSAVQDPSNLGHVRLTFSSTFNSGSSYSLSSENVEDLNNNPSSLNTLSFVYLVAETPLFGDVVINEFLCDPTPSQGLPEVEFVEIFNRSAKYFNLENWQLGDASSFGTIQNAWLNPGEYLLLVPTTALANYPSAVGVSSFPSLNNSGDDIILQSANALEIDKISYSDTWYNDDLKSNGGYSIERINPTLLCSGISDWSASNAGNGGTPGTENSLFDTSPDLTAPILISKYALAPNFVELNFNEGLDSSSIADALFTFSPARSVNQIYSSGKYPNNFTLELNENFIPGTFYSVWIDGISDCSGNSIDLTFQLILPEEGQGNELIINEILYNPITGGSDYIELYNQSDQYIDIKDWSIGIFKDDTISNIETVPTNYLLAPKDFVVLTEDSSAQLNQYPFAVNGKFVEMDLPSFNNDSNTVYVLLNNIISDQLSYTDQWQFQLLDDSDGKALERFSYTEETNDSDNWHTASEAVSFGTPGRENSQVISINYLGDFYVSSTTISPDNDGFEDVVIITYEMNKPDLIGSVKIYNDRGVEVKVLSENYLLGNKGTFSWDGLNEENNKVSIGPYIILFEATDLSTGEVLIKKQVVTLAGKL